MLMRGNALVLKTPVENAPRTSIEKHLSWSSDEELAKHGLIEVQTGSPYNSPILFTLKPNSTEMQFCFDSLELNKTMLDHPYPAPTTEEPRLYSNSSAPVSTSISVGMAHCCIVEAIQQWAMPTTGGGVFIHLRDWLLPPLR